MSYYRDEEIKDHSLSFHGQRDVGEIQQDATQHAWNSQFGPKDQLEEVPFSPGAGIQQYQA